MNADLLRELFNYNYWAHRRVWQCIEGLTDEQFNEKLDYSVGSIRNQVHHMIVVEWHWLNFLKLGDFSFRTQVPRRNRYTTRADLRGLWDTVEHDMQGYLASLSNETATGTITVDNGDIVRHIPRWKLLMQVYTHGVDHRAQVLAMLHKLGASTVEQDWLHFVWEHTSTEPHSKGETAL